jgi:hypothetical protein
MTHAKSHRLKEMLILEYQLLVDGKLVPDAGASRAHIERRLRQIEVALMGAGFIGEFPRTRIDRTAKQRAVAEWRIQRLSRQPRRSH